MTAHPPGPSRRYGGTGTVEGAGGDAHGEGLNRGCWAGTLAPCLSFPTRPTGVPAVPPKGVWALGVGRAG